MLSLSVIIPCKNEERFIARCLDALIQQNGVNSTALEIIVIDNGSTDGTLKILEEYKPTIRVLSLPNRTISELRNYGASRAGGKWFAFVDADVEVSLNWYANLCAHLVRVKDQQVITGSTYSIPQDSTWVQRAWFGQLTARDAKSSKYINGGNLIVHKDTFEAARGFSLRFKTGEDVNFCENARLIGATIIPNSLIGATHHGYPRTVYQFFVRERWHGLGMRGYLHAPWKSRALMFVIYYLLVSSAMLSVYVLAKTLFSAFGFFAIALLIPSLTLAFFRCHSKPEYLFTLTFLYIVYGLARSLSVLDIMVGSYQQMRKKGR